MPIPVLFSLPYARHTAASVLCCAALFGAPGVNGAEPLTLAEAQRLALQTQPLLEAQAAAIEALRERSLVAAQLPDPKVQTALSDVPSNGAHAWSLSRDFETDLMIGFMQEFPRAAKRRLRGERASLQAQQAEAALDRLRREVRREAAFAFLDVAQAERARELTERLSRESALQGESTEARLRSGLVAQADLLAIALETGMLRDRVAALRQSTKRAQRVLARWIGEEAHRPLAWVPRNDLRVPALARLLETLDEHPELASERLAADLARAGVALARESYRPDWSLEVGYAYRPEFPEMMTIRATVDLPLFRRNRQDRELSAARRELASSEAQRESRLRELAAQLAAAYDDWRALGERGERFRRELLPQARTRIDAATAAYAAGVGSLSDVLTARRAGLEIELHALELAFTRERRWLELEYFASEGAFE